MTDNWLSDFSASLEFQRVENEKQRLFVNKQLEKMGPVIFISDPETPDIGVGWFKVQGGFVAYRKYKNGYEARPFETLPDAFVRQLSQHLPGMTQ